MSTISTTPRRPSTAQPSSLNTRMPYEAGEALLWERQNARMHTHLSLQLKELQTQHAAYESRITATEAIAEAAEAAVHQVKHLDLKINAIEEEEKDRPFDKWAKEAVAQLQVAVDGLKGVRAKISGLESKVDGLGEDLEGVRGDGALLRTVVRRLEVLERDRMDERRRVERRDTAGCRQGDVYEGAGEGSYDEATVDDNPLAVFYGIDTQSSVRCQESPSRRPSLSHPSPVTYQQPSPKHMGQILEEVPQNNCGWESTQQFKDMQRELAELRAMCQTQESKNGNDTADVTQRPQETLIVHRENQLEFSDATTEAEAESNDAGLGPSHIGASRGQVDLLISDMTLPSSPPKRSDTQSARRKLMKRSSINDPRVSSVDEDGHHTRAKPNHTAHTSLLTKQPVDIRADNGDILAKRKRIDDTPTRRVTRPKLSDDPPAAGEMASSTAREAKANDERIALEAAPLAFGAPTPASPTRKAYRKRKPVASRPLETPAPQASWSRPQQVAAEPAAEIVRPHDPISKSKPTPKASAQQPTPAQADSSGSKGLPAVKKEPKAPRQPAGACKSCRARHQKCDRTQPACGRCVKFSLSCEYHHTVTPGSTVLSNKPSTASPRKKQVLPQIKKADNEAIREHDLRGRSVTISPEAPQQRPVKRPMLASPSKKTAVAAVPTAASSRALRAKNTQKLKMSPQKEMQK
ncbi:hypothetical protein SVAN01_07091 [Stagonosporopsis vannaccii]|nr:hypothetical protein SVAN01_07091 [Stagonosporopsis vannaccii]